MNPVTLFLLTIAAIFLIGTLGEVVFKRTNVPDVVWLILMGLFLGPVTGLVHASLLSKIAPYFAALTLIVILFEGGIRLNIKEVAREAPRSGLLALMTFAVSVALVALTAFIPATLGFFPGWTWKHCLLLGTILGGSSSIVVMPTLQRAKVEAKTSSLLNLESAFTDVFCVVGASALIGLMGRGPVPSPLEAFSRSLGIGFAAGAVSGLLWLFILRHLRSADNAYPITFSALLILYVAIDRFGGSAALGILVFAVIVGNAGWIAFKAGAQGSLDMGRSIRDVHSQMAFIIKSFFFTFIGAMLTPPWTLIGFGVLLGFLLVPARIPGALMAGAGGRLGPGGRKLVTVALPRGMAAGVLATMPAAAGIPATGNFPVIVFACVFTTILIFAAGFPLALGKAPEGAEGEASGRDQAAKEKKEAGNGGNPEPAAGSEREEQILEGPKGRLP